jgi:hypothetical protein
VKSTVPSIRKHLIFLLLIFAGFGPGCSNSHQQPEGHVQVRLGGSVFDVIGHDWPTYSDGTLFEMSLVQQAAMLTVKIDEVETETRVTGASIHQSEGKIVSVNLFEQRAGSSIDDSLSQLSNMVHPFLTKFFDNEENLDAGLVRLKRQAINVTEGWPTELAFGISDSKRLEVRYGIHGFFSDGSLRLDWGSFVSLYYLESDNGFGEGNENDGLEQRIGSPPLTDG